MDGASDVTDLYFRLEIGFVTTVVQQFVISKTGVHVGFAIISGDGFIISDFNSNTDSASFVGAIEKAPYPGESRQGGKALVLAKETLFGTSARKDATKVSNSQVLLCSNLQLESTNHKVSPIL